MRLVEEYKDDDSIHQVDLAEGYRLEYSAKEMFFFCLKTEQTCKYIL